MADDALDSAPSPTVRPPPEPYTTRRPGTPPPTTRPQSTPEPAHGPEPTTRSGPHRPAPTTHQPPQGRGPGHGARPRPAARPIPGSPKAGGGPGGLRELLRDIEREFPSVQDLPSSGGESNLFKVTDSAGRQYVFKIYKPEIQIDEAALEHIRTNGNPKHVVRVIRHGRTHGLWWEIQEFVKDGSLANVLRTAKGMPGSPNLVRHVAEQIANALHHVHDELNLVHYDLKPSNVLVRDKATTFDLVLADFGLMTLDMDSLRPTEGSGTIEYQAPEVVLGFGGGKGRDYWALGMMLAELAGGRHPFAGLSRVTILRQIGLGAVDLARVTDDRVKLLCRGLLVRDPNHRWGHAEVHQWLAGETPDVHVDSPGPTTGAAPDALAPFTFRSASYNDRAELAAAMAASWTDAARLLAGPNQRQRVVGWLGQFPHDERVASLLDDWHVTQPHPDRAVVQLLLALDPARTAVSFKGFDLQDGGIVSLAAEVIRQGGQGEASDAMDGLLQHDVLGLCAALPRQQYLAEVDRAWRQEVASFASTIERARQAGGPEIAAQVQAVARARLLMATVEDPTGKRLQAEAREKVRPDLKEVTWFAGVMGNRPGPGRIVAALTLVPSASDALEAARQAREQTRRADEQRRREAARARELVRLARPRLCLVGLLKVIAPIALALAAASVILPRVNLTEASEDAIQALDVAMRYRFVAVPYGALLVLGVIAVWLTRKGASAPLRRLLQALCVAASLLVPFTLPFTIRYAFGTLKQFGEEPGRDRQLRRWCFAATGVLITYAGCLWAEVRHGVFASHFDYWPDGLQGWFLDSWPSAIRPAELAAQWDSTIELSLALALAGMTLVVRSYRARPVAERRLMQVVTVAGAVAVVPLAPAWGSALVSLSGGSLAMGATFIVVAVWLITAWLKAL